MVPNPFVISFGRKPTQYIERSIIVDEITDELRSDTVQNQCFMLAGVRGSGKTVTMSAIEQKLRDDKDWIVVDLNVERDMLTSLVAKLYDSNKISNFFDTQINLSAFGIGVSVKNVSPVADIESAVEKILKELKKRKKRLLVTVDEVYNTQYIKEFAGSFQIMIRQELPMYLIMAGLYENIHNLEDEKNLTFLYRAPKYYMDPLSYAAIKKSYMEILGIPENEALAMAKLTKGYPFAYQALGKYVWESKDHRLTDDVIYKYDEALRAYVYDKIWSELSEKDRWNVSFITTDDSMKVADFLDRSGQTKSEFSQYRERLRNKGIIDTTVRGYISIRLPRFTEYVKNKTEL